MTGGDHSGSSFWFSNKQHYLSLGGVAAPLSQPSRQAGLQEVASLVHVVSLCFLASPQSVLAICWIHKPVFPSEFVEFASLYAHQRVANVEPQTVSVVSDYPNHTFSGLQAFDSGALYKESPIFFSWHLFKWDKILTFFPEFRPGLLLHFQGPCSLITW